MVRVDTYMFVRMCAYGQLSHSATPCVLFVSAMKKSPFLGVGMSLCSNVGAPSNRKYIRFHNTL